MDKEQCDLIISGGTLVTQNAQHQVINDGAIAIRGDKLAAVGPRQQVHSQFEAGRVMDASGRYVFPGLINTHTHLFQTFIKGLGEGLSLYEWVDGIAAPSSVAMTDRDGYLSAMLGGLEALRSGTTTVLDFMYSMPMTRLYRAVGHACKDLGLRGVLGLGLMETGEQHDLSPCQFNPVPQALADWDNLTAELDSDLLTFALAPEVPFGITPLGFELIRQYATQHHMLITLHINEVLDDDRAMLADHGQRAVPFLEKMGFWGPDVLGVHCVKMQPEDIEIFARRDVKVSHNPVSNMYLGVGRMPLLEMRRAGLTISLATDGAGSNNSQDMLEVMKCTALMHKLGHENPQVINAQDVLDMATTGGARAIGEAERLGSLEVGKQADLFILDPRRPKATPVFNPVTSLVFSAGEDSVVTTLVAGQVLLEDGVILSVDEPALLQECQSAAWALARRVGYAP